MAPAQADMIQTIREFVLREFLPGEPAENLREDTPLISGGILDSISTLRLVSFLEERYGVEFEAFELSVDHMDSVAQVADLVAAKREG